MRKLHLFIICGLLAAATALQAQKELSQEDLASHLLKFVPPVYPAIAKAAHVQGDVVVSVELAPNGTVKSTKLVSGPPMLRQVTIDALQHWTYQPFQDGSDPIEVTGNVTVSFTLVGGAAVHTPHEVTANGKY